ncbi:prepilin peptidase [bacterium]|nr:prepilin peptidase [bacterium]
MSNVKTRPLSTMTITKKCGIINYMEYSTGILVNSIGLIYIMIASYWDYRYKKIPNKLNFPIIIAGVVINYYLHGMVGLKLSVFGLLLGLGLLFVPFALGGVGAGDVKLLAGIGALKGPHFVFWVFLIFSLIYFVISIVYLLVRGQLVKIIKNMIMSIYTRTPATGTIYDKSGSVSFPIGVVISLGCLVTEYVFRFHFFK